MCLNWGTLLNLSGPHLLTKLQNNDKIIMGLLGRLKGNEQNLNDQNLIYYENSTQKICH